MYSPSLLDHVNVVGKDDQVFLVATVNEERELVGLIEVGGGREVYRDVSFSDICRAHIGFEMERIWRILGGPARDFFLDSKQ
jgi:hypothetical protein